MTPAEIKNTRLYRTVAPCVRKEDREELARMLAMVPESAWTDELYEGMDSIDLSQAFNWKKTPQGGDYWFDFSHLLLSAGHECW